MRSISSLFTRAPFKPLPSELFLPRAVPAGPAPSWTSDWKANGDPKVDGKTNLDGKDNSSGWTHGPRTFRGSHDVRLFPESGGLVG